MKSFNPSINLTIDTTGDEVTIHNPSGQLYSITSNQDILSTPIQSINSIITGSISTTGSYMQKAQQDTLPPDMRTVLDNLEDLIIELKNDRRSTPPSQEGYKALMDVYDKVIRQLMDYRYSLTSNQSS